VNCSCFDECRRVSVSGISRRLQGLFPGLQLKFAAAFQLELKRLEPKCA
jgi:hypothetical protein